MSYLKLIGICKNFGETIVLDNINLKLYEGELLVLLGPSGCGKSTLLRLIAGLETLTSGEIYLNGDRIDQKSPKDRGVSMVFQNYSLYPHMSVEKNIGFPLKIARMNKKEIKAKVLETAAMLGLTDKLQDKPGELSGGQRQRVALGRAIVREPSIFLLDEPLSNLDADLRIRMRQEIVKIQKGLNKTLIHVTHDQSEALTMADRIVLLNEGKIAQIGTPEELYKNPASTYVANFIGFPKINLIDGGTAFGKRLTEQENIIIGLRPEDIIISSEGEYKGIVVASEYLGEHYIVTIKIDDIELTISGVKQELLPETEINISINKSAILRFDKQTQKLISK